MRRLITASILLLFLLTSCATPSYVIDNSRLKFQSFDELTVKAIAIKQSGESETDLIALLTAENPQIAVLTADKRTISEIVDLIPMNVAKISSTEIITTTGIIESKSDDGAVIRFSDVYEVQVLIDSDIYQEGPVLIAGTQTITELKDIYTLTHSGDKTLPYTIFTRGVLPLNSTDIRDTYAGYEGIICSFALAQ